MINRHEIEIMLLEQEVALGSGPIDREIEIQEHNSYLEKYLSKKQLKKGMLLLADPKQRLKIDPCFGRRY